MHPRARRFAVSFALAGLIATSGALAALPLSTTIRLPKPSTDRHNGHRYATNRFQGRQARNGARGWLGNGADGHDPGRRGQPVDDGRQRRATSSGNHGDRADRLWVSSRRALEPRAELYVQLRTRSEHASVCRSLTLSKYRGGSNAAGFRTSCSILRWHAGRARVQRS